MFAWGLVTLAHALIKNKAGYLTGDSTFLSGLAVNLSDLLDLVTVRACELPTFRIALYMKLSTRDCDYGGGRHTCYSCVSRRVLQINRTRDPSRLVLGCPGNSDCSETLYLPIIRLKCFPGHR